MATILLSAAGSAIGGSIGGTVLGLSAATIGQAVGATAGAIIDQTILGSGSRAVESGRARSLHLQTSTEGTPIPLVFGRMRIAGQVVWSTRFKEHVRTTTQGGKATGGQKVKEFSYSISLALGLSEGPIERIGRVWADGKLLATEDLEMRVYPGDENQLPDPKIEAVEGVGNVPAYRGLAYVVFEDLPLEAFGNRIPQLNFEVFRSAASLVGTGSPEAGTPLKQLVRGVALSPGSGEFALDPKPAQHKFPGGGGVFANINNASGRPDILEALDQLDGELPAAGAVSLLVSWFGDDLRAGQCTVQPRVEEPGRGTDPEDWSAAGLTTDTAPPVSRDANDRPNFGGSPADGSVIRAIAELQSRGKQVMLYPFLLMDIPAGNALIDPYTGLAGQPAFPWRGRITSDLAPGAVGSSDQTAAAAAEVAAFFGTAQASDFTVSAGQVSYSGPAEWGWRRFVLHLAALGSAAGGVDAICIGSELRGLTTLRDSATTYPAVAELKALAAEVRLLLPTAKIGYAADWSEYFGHHPQDGTGDVLFHLDPLWSDANIDFVGIDDYTSLSDWRHARTHLDLEVGHDSIYSLPYLQGNVEGGENYDWFYASQADRESQIRTPIDDTGFSEHWVFRPKDFRAWWSNQHFDRIGGVRSTTPTAWVPESKPIWLTETGCPAVDLGSNQPNLFSDAKSSESALPFGSLGVRD
ncbi:MAG: glycoside hydrolase TIM-barrel-like domain-containing protein, partial [Paracoccaceae bacterium]